MAKTSKKRVTKKKVVDEKWPETMQPARSNRIDPSDNISTHAKVSLTKLQRYYIRGEYERQTPEDLAHFLGCNLGEVKEYVASLPSPKVLTAYDLMGRGSATNEEAGVAVMTKAASEMADTVKQQFYAKQRKNTDRMSKARK